MAVASYLKFHPNLSKHGGGGANSEMQSGLASAASAKQEESQRQRQRLVESILITPKGQIISECLFDFLNFPKNHRKI